MNDDTILAWFGGTIIGFMLLLILFFIIASFTGFREHYADGDHVGTIVQIANEGLFVKCQTGKLSLGNIGGNTSTTWDFCVENPAIIQDIQAAANSGARVNLHYHAWVISPWRLTRNTVVDSITPAPLESK